MTPTDVWWHHTFELNYYEGVVLVALMIVALIFDQIWDRILHQAGRTFVYDAEEHAHSHENHGHHHRLLHLLADRAQGEFMILGFLALVVFVVQQSHGFDWMANTYHCTTSFAYPVSAADWYDLAEVTHMQLFGGVMLYYFYVFLIVLAAIRKLRSWEKLWLLVAQEMEKQETKSVRKAMLSLQRSYVDIGRALNFREHVAWSSYLTGQVMDWKTSRPSAFQGVVEIFGLDADSEDIVMEVSEVMKDSFALSSYLAWCVENSLKRFIIIHPLTWLFFIAILLVFTLLHGYLELTLLNIVPFVLGTKLFIDICMLCFVKYCRSSLLTAESHWQRSITQTLQDEATNTQSRTSKSVMHTVATIRAAAVAFNTSLGVFSGPLRGLHRLHQRFSLDHTVLSIVQLLLFFMCILFVRSVSRLNYWQDNWNVMVIVTACYIALGILIAVLMPVNVPIFLALLGLPPYMDQHDIHYLLLVLRNVSKDQVCSESGRTKEHAEGKEETSDEAPLPFPFPTSKDSLDAQFVAKELRLLSDKVHMMEDLLSEDGMGIPSLKQRSRSKAESTVPKAQSFGTDAFFTVLPGQLD